MAAPKIDLARWIARIPEHTGAMPMESEIPIEHYRRGANDAWNLLGYFERNAKGTTVYPAAYKRHIVRLRSMVLLALVETFERFLKESAAVCVDQLAAIVLDDRLSFLSSHGATVAAHFDEGTIGKALCEGGTWLDSSEINKRFGKLLADHFGEPKWKFFPEGKKDPDAWRRGTMDILWQLRHSIAHNVGVLTKSDAAKLRLLRRGPVGAPKVLELTNGDVWYAKLYLDDLAQWANERVATRLAEVLSARYADDPSLLPPASERAASVAKLFQVAVTVEGAHAAP